MCTTDELQETPGGIARANLDGTGVDLEFISGIDAGYVAVDAQYIYWTGNFCDGVCTGGSADPWVPAIGRANLDGTGVDRSFIVTGTNVTADLAVDAGHIYWTVPLCAPACCGAALGRASLDGTSVDPMFISGSCCLKPPFWAGVAVDGPHLYWTEYLFGAPGPDAQHPPRQYRRQRHNAVRPAGRRQGLPSRCTRARRRHRRQGRGPGCRGLDPTMKPGPAIVVKPSRSRRGRS